MAVFEVGRVCVKTRGREKGEKCVVTEVLDRNFVVVVGPRVRRRRVNLSHLRPLEVVVPIPEGASDEEAIKALEGV